LQINEQFRIQLTNTGFFNLEQASMIQPMLMILIPQCSNYSSKYRTIGAAWHSPSRVSVPYTRLVRQFSLSCPGHLVHLKKYAICSHPVLLLF
jgi:hypothetical protein